MFVLLRPFMISLVSTAYPFYIITCKKNITHLMIPVSFPAEPLVEAFLPAPYPELSLCADLLNVCFFIFLTACGLLHDCSNIAILLFVPTFVYHTFTCTFVKYNWRDQQLCSLHMRVSESWVSISPSAPIPLNLIYFVQSVSLTDTFLVLLLVSVSHTKVQAAWRLNLKWP